MIFEKVTGRARQAIGAAVVVCLVAPAAHAQDSVQVVTLDEALALAMAADPAVIAALGSVGTARAAVRQANAAWLPSLVANSGYSNSSNQRFDQSTGQLVSESYTAQLAASYALFTGGRRPAAVGPRGTAARVCGDEARGRHRDAIRPPAGRA